MIQPGRYDITLQRRADYSVIMQFKDSEEDPIDLTGWTVKAQAWNAGRTKKYADFTTVYTSRVNGQVKLKLTYQQTTSMPTPCEYDVLLINGAGEREYYVEGTITASEGYTEAA